MADDRAIARLQAVVEAYGANPERWPAAERETLEATAARHGDLPFLADARLLDGLLDAVPGGAMRAGLVADIVAAAGGQPQASPERVISLAGRRGSRQWWTGTFAQGAVLAASLVVGLWIGNTGIADILLAGVEPDQLSALTVIDQDEANFLAAVGADDVSL